MARKNAQNKSVKNENLVDVSWNVSFEAKLSPKVKEFLSTTTEAGKTVISVGQKLLPILILLGTITTSCAPKQPEPNPPNPAAIESTQTVPNAQ